MDLKEIVKIGLFEPVWL